MNQPRISTSAWTEEEQREVEKLASKTMERIAEQTGSYMDYESCIYAAKLALIQRQVDNTMRKLEELANTEDKLLRNLEDDRDILW